MKCRDNDIRFVDVSLLFARRLFVLFCWTQLLFYSPLFLTLERFSFYLFSCAFVFNPNIAARQHASHKESHTMQLLRKYLIRFGIQSFILWLILEMRSVRKQHTHTHTNGAHASFLSLSVSRFDWVSPSHLAQCSVVPLQSISKRFLFLCVCVCASCAFFRLNR